MSEELRNFNGITESVARRYGVHGFGETIIAYELLQFLESLTKSFKYIR